MNIKITINSKNSNTVNCTVYAGDTKTNIGTLWMTQEEFDTFVNMLTFGISGENTLEVDDAVSDYEYTDIDG